MVRAILGCLLMVAGALIGVQEFLFSDNNLWLAIGLSCIGILFLVRRTGPSIDDHGDPACRTCRGAGTVYSDEYNDWRQTGPIKVIRELCPTCEGLAV